ncbi:MAG: DUF4386 domain-containing protein [Chloroflexota bacterium]
MNSVNKTARIAGFFYLLLLPLGILGILYVPTTLVVNGDSVATARNILAHESLYRLSIVSALLIPIVNIFVVLFLFKLLKPVNNNVAALMVIFILLGAPIAMLNEVNSVAVLLLLQSADLYGLMALFLDMHEVGIQIAGLFWGLWLFPMGCLVFKSNYIPKFIGILLMIGCFGYLFDSFMFLLFPDLGVTVSQFTFIGELVLPLWLVTKGVDVDRWEKRVQALA